MKCQFHLRRKPEYPEETTIEGKRTSVLRNMALIGLLANSWGGGGGGHEVVGRGVVCSRGEPLAVVINKSTSIPRLFIYGIVWPYRCFLTVASNN